MSLKIGIITHYTKNMNYGGTLQAYALCEFLNKNGFNAEQIRFLGESFYLNDSNSSINCSQNKTIKFIKKRKAKFNVFIYTMLNSKRRMAWFRQRGRIKKVKRFLDIIPHSSKCYNSGNICQAESEYDVFITGSDQVWNPKWYKSVYFLDFVTTKPKLSYAASISQNTLNDYQKSVFAKSLQSFKAISVRELEGQALLKEIIDLPTEWVLDPTLLLSRDEWDNIVTHKIVDDKYLICYFLGEDLNARNIACQYAKNHNLKVVSLPNIFGKYRDCDNYGDIGLYNISPADFISLIKYASAVFTDSFHACVFSEIFNRQYYAFERDSSNEMGSRLYSLTRIFEHEDRYLDDEQKNNIDYVENMIDIDYSFESETFLKIKEKSVLYLKSNLNQIRRKLYNSEN